MCEQLSVRGNDAGMIQAIKHGSCTERIMENACLAVTDNDQSKPAAKPVQDAKEFVARSLCEKVYGFIVWAVANEHLPDQNKVAAGDGLRCNLRLRMMMQVKRTEMVPRPSSVQRVPCFISRRWFCRRVAKKTKSEQPILSACGLSRVCHRASFNAPADAEWS